MRLRRTLALALAAAAAGASAASAAPPEVVSAQGTATVDGVAAAGEWAAAAREEFRLNDSGAPATFLVMNDGSSLYLAVQVTGPNVGWSALLVNFDNDGDGVPAEGDDALRVYAWNGSYRSLYDGYFTKKLPCPLGVPACYGIDDTETGGTTDVRAAAATDGSTTFYEIAKPLDSADDGHDFSVGAGDLVAVLANSEIDLCDGARCSHTGIPGPVQIVIAPYGAPTVASVGPVRGAPGTPVTLTGRHLAGASSVTFGGIASTFVVTGNTKIETSVPDGARAGPIAVTTPAGTATAPFAVLVPAPLIGPAVAAPPALRAGAVATISFAVTRSDTRRAAAGATITCDPSLGGRVLAHSERLANGVATVRIRVPAEAKGRVLTVRLAVRWQGRAAARTATFRVG